MSRRKRGVVKNPKADQRAPQWGKRQEPPPQPKRKGQKTPGRPTEPVKGDENGE
jgi:hypothetical protein